MSDYTRSSFSTYSSGASDDFDPEHEAFTSTGRVGYDDDDFSVEVGRGHPKSTRLDDSRSSVMSFYDNNNSIRSSSPAIRVDYPALNTSPKPHTRNSKRAVSDNLRRDAQLRQASRASKKPLEPRTSASNRNDQRRSLSDMHAKVRDTYDGSVIEDERPLPSNPISARTTRFGNNTSKQVQNSIRKASEGASIPQIREEVERIVADGRHNPSVNNTPVKRAPAAGDTGTQQSILLPDFLPLSDLVSMHDEPKPVQNRVRTTRFVSPPNDTDEVSIAREYQPLDFVPVPEDEKAIFAALKMIQHRAAELEMEKANAEKEELMLRRENAALKAGRFHRNDSHGRTTKPRRSRAHESAERPNPGNEDATDVSSMGERELAKLRKQLETERHARRRRRSLTKEDLTVETTASSHYSLPKPEPRRKPSNKENKAPHVRAASPDVLANSTADLAKSFRLRNRSIRELRKEAAGEPTPAREAVKSTHGSQPKPAPVERSATNDSKRATGRPASAGDDMATSSKGRMGEGVDRPGTERRRRHSDHFANLASHRRQRQNVEDMTSAFILPDITLSHVDAVAERHEQLPESAQRTLDHVAHHKGQNCTVCKPVGPEDYNCDHVSNAPKPIPVSERIPKSAGYEEDNTLRPAQDPGAALATVLKALEDELAHLRMKLATYQGAYYKLDPSMSRHKRKSLRQKIERSLHDADMKADQIYGLYDVLEGQKKARHQITEEQMDDTLHSIGIDVDTQHQKPAADADKDHSTNINAESDLEDEELPWEGIESTGDITGRSTGSRRGY